MMKMSAIGWFGKKSLFERMSHVKGYSTNAAMKLPADFGWNICIS